MTLELETITVRINDAATYLDVFGQLEGDKFSRRLDVKRAYKKLVKVVHPDIYVRDEDRRLASEAFLRLKQFEQQAQTAIDDDSYGTAQQTVIKTKRYEHTVERLIAHGDVADLYRTRSEPGGKTVLKVARHPKDADLMTAEAKALKQLRRKGSDETLHPYVPKLLETIRIKQDSIRRRANVTEQLLGFYNLEQVHQEYPGGVNPLDMTWMWRRLLVAIGFAHEQQLIHGAVLPNHVMILPEKHGLVLVDWCYSVSFETEEPPAIKAVSTAYRDWYPKEVISKQSPSVGTDIDMAAKTMVYLLGGDPVTMWMPMSVPKAFRAFFRGCVASNQNARPQNAWALLGEFDGLLEGLGAPYYPRRFRPFSMPS